MEKKEFIDRLKELTVNEDVFAVSRAINELRGQFEDFCIEQDRLKQVALLEAQERGETVDFTNESDPLKEEFYTVFSEYKERRNKLSSEKKLEEESNLRKKKSLIDRLTTLIASEENIGAAVEMYKEIHEAWKTVGDIPREKRQDIQSEYSKLLESFFFNLKIYRELKDHDLKRNFQLKKEIVAKIETLLSNDTIRDLEAQIKLLQNEFDSLGPVPKEEWEALKNEYWIGVKAVYQKITDFYEGKRQEQKQNLEHKHTLLVQVKEFVGTIHEITDAKSWESATEKLLTIQNEWKTIGQGPRKENEELWGALRAECDVFFAAKKAFYQVIKDKFEVVAKQKNSLIEKVLALKDSSDWKVTSEKIIRLQQEWRNLGSAGQKNEQKLWKDFRSACDAFFENKKQFFAKEDEVNATNLEAKNALITEIEAYVVGEDKQQVIADLKEFSNRFNAIGKVPFKEKDIVYQAFKNGLDIHYKKIKLEGAEKEQVMFQAHLDTLKSNPNASKLIDKERRDLEQMVAKQQQDINQLENNLGFVSKSKAGDALRKDVEHKINVAKDRIKEYKTKIKLLTKNE
jgi:hypothetical protein